MKGSNTNLKKKINRKLHSLPGTNKPTFFGAWMASLKAETGFLLLASIGLVKH